MGGTCGMHGGNNAYKILTEKHQGKRPLEGPGHKFKYNIKIDIKMQKV
jgi:hypothetical protein